MEDGPGCVGVGGAEEGEARERDVGGHGYGKIGIGRGLRDLKVLKDRVGAVDGG